MAFNWKTFQTRALSAIVFVIIMAVGLLWDEWSFFILFSIVHFGCWVEYQKLVEKFNVDYKKIIPFHRYGIMIAGWCIMLFFSNDAYNIGQVSLTQIGFWLGILFMILLPLMMFMESRHLFLRNIVFSFFGLLYISLSLALLVNLRNHWVEDDYRLNLAVPLLIIFTLWINDTMAYIVGSLIGKTRMTSISPNKTWEGTIGGIILAVIVIGLIAYFTERVPVVDAIILATLAAIAATYGDLFESKLKRMAKVKDSGTIMPGHGGFLDRFDSLLFASTVCWIYAYFFL